MPLGFNETESVGQRGNPSHHPGFLFLPRLIVLKPVGGNISSGDTAEGNICMMDQEGC